MTMTERTAPRIPSDRSGLVKLTLSMLLANLGTFWTRAVFIEAPAGLMAAWGAARQSRSDSLAGLVLALFASGLVTAVLVHDVKSLLDGRPTDLGTSIRVGIGRIAPVILATVLAGAVLTVGFAFFVLPGVILAARLAVVIPAIVVDGAGVRAAFKRSMALTRGKSWKVLLFQVHLGLYGLAVYLAGTTVFHVLGLERGTAASFVMETSMSALASCIMGIGQVLLYYSLADRAPSAPPATIPATG